jgi:membrane-associated phospholipid phosphatase
MAERQTQPLQQRMASLDEELSARIRQVLAAQSRLHCACLVIAHTGDGFVCMLGLAASALLIPSARITIARLFVASLLAAGLVGAGKLTFRRARPLPDPSHRWSWLGRHDEHAFPSGHAARTASIASVACRISPTLGLVAWAWSIGVSLCRVGLGAHYAGDIAVGMALGALSAWLVHAFGWP